MTDLLTERRGAALWITISREERRNAMNKAVLAGLQDAIANLDPAIRAVVLTGAGRKAFCAGADLSDGAATFTLGLDEPTTDFGQLARRVRELGVPLIGRINGDCVAGGMALMGLCDLIVVAGRPSMGKTALAMNIAEHAAIEQNLPVLVVSLEMQADQLTRRTIGSVGRINQQRIKTGTLSDDDWSRLSDTVEKMRGHTLDIIDEGSSSIASIRSEARRAARRYKQLGLIVVDYLQLLESRGESTENRATEVAQISRGLKLLAKEMQCPVIALSQLNRGVENRTDKRPLMSDLRESGSIEQDADIVMFIYRDEYYAKEGSKEPGVAEVIIGKQRNGPTGTVKLAWQAEYTRFGNLQLS